MVFGKKTIPKFSRCWPINNMMVFSLVIITMLSFKILNYQRQPWMKIGIGSFRILISISEYLLPTRTIMHLQ